MTPEEYFGQGEYYFSESSKQMVRIEDMPLPHALNALRKLEQTYDPEFEYDLKFEDTRLAHALYNRLCPTTQELAFVLARYGKASYFARGRKAQARARLYAAGRRIGKRVRTHLKGEFMEGTVEESQVEFRVRRVRV